MVHHRRDGRWHEIAGWIVRQLAVNVRIDRQRRPRRERERAAISGGGLEGFQRDAPTGTGLVLNDARVLLVRRPRKLLTDASGHAVARAAGGEALVDLDLIDSLRKRIKRAQCTERCDGQRGFVKLAT